MSISIAGIEAKIQAYAKSDAGKAKIKNTIAHIRKSGGKTAGGTELITPQKAAEVSVSFKEILIKNAASCGLPASVMEHITSMVISPVIVSKDAFSVNLPFGGDLHRDSVENDYKEYGGIDNIVALFNNGHKEPYKPSTYGWWNNHRPTGEALGRSLHNESFAWIKTKNDRRPLKFIQNAVNEFNSLYGAKYNITVVVPAVYEE